MKKLLLTMAAVSSLTLNAQTLMDGRPKREYPKTVRDNTTDDYFGTTVTDPYRWLEDDRSKQTAEWVAQQNEITFAYLNKIPFRDRIRERMQQLWNYERVSAPSVEGDYTYYYKNNGLQNQNVMYRRDKAGKEEIFLDPNTFSKDGTTSLGGVNFTTKGDLVAYSISEGGSDWRTVIVMDAKTKKPIGQPIVNVKFSGMAWKGSEGFYYSSYDKPKGSELSAMTDQHKLYYHKLGTPQSADKVVFGDKEKRRYISGYVTEDNRYLVISAANSTSGNELYIMDLTKPGSKIVQLTTGFADDSYVLDNVGTKLYISTNHNAPNGKIVMVDAATPQQANWKDVIAETENVLSPSTGGGYIFAEYMKDAISVIKQYDYDGRFIRDIDMPGVGSGGGFGGKKADKTLYYSFTSYTTPASIYSYDAASGKSDVYYTPKVDFNPADYVSEQVFYKSKDGTRIPMIITYKKGLKKNGKTPTMLYGYGGFNASITPYFSVANAVWMENGGIYAVPNIRGGGEYGKKWHDAGTRMQKQNVFDDFIAAAEYLITNGYTNPDHLAISGGSNGGLLVGAVMTQRPDLMKVALPAVGVLDMLRYHTFTAGAGWAYDYGTAADSKEMFEYLKGYSPLHNIKKGTNYPATLITTGDHDDRVVPAHSFKFAATLQEAQAGSNPVMIRIGVKAGHGAGKSITQVIEEYSDVQAFTLYAMGVSPYGR
ncbi:MAG: prolyl oligopeptidase family serine peptidase [Flavobacterium sp.]